MILTIFTKEMREILRDKRMLFLVILMPFFIYPLIFLLMGKVGAGQEEKIQREKISLFVSGLPDSHELMTMLSADSSLVLQPGAFDKAMLDSVPEAMGLEIPADFEEKIKSGQTASPILYVDESDFLLNAKKASVQALVAAYSDKLLSGRLAAQSLSPDFVKPVSLRVEDVSTRDDKLGRLLGTILPSLLLLLIFTGCIYIAIDITAGEKERKTLQTLYVTTASENAIIAGKFLAVASVGLSSAFMNVLSLLLGLKLQMGELGQNPDLMSLSISGASWLGLLLLIVLSTAFLAAISMVVSVLANSYKEAQSYITPLMMLVLLPIMVSQMPGLELTVKTAMIPMLNISLAMGSLLASDASYEMVALVLAMLLVYILLALWFAGRVFSNENIVTGGKWSWRDFLR
jgi:sodium transport system permease protein